MTVPDNDVSRYDPDELDREILRSRGRRQPEHGTYARYQRAGGGCRCEACRAANTAYMRGIRADPSKRNRERAGARARERALWRLVDAHRGEYRQLCVEELTRDYR